MTEKGLAITCHNTKNKRSILSLMIKTVHIFKSDEHRQLKKKKKKKKKKKNKKKTNKCPRPWSWGLGGRLLVQAAKE